MDSNIRRTALYRLVATICKVLFFFDSIHSRVHHRLSISVLRLICSSIKRNSAKFCYFLWWHATCQLTGYHKFASKTFSLPFRIIKWLYLLPSKIAVQFKAAKAERKIMAYFMGNRHTISSFSIAGSLIYALFYCDMACMYICFGMYTGWKVRIWNDLIAEILKNFCQHVEQLHNWNPQLPAQPKLVP